MFYAYCQNFSKFRLLSWQICFFHFFNFLCFEIATFPLFNAIAFFNNFLLFNNNFWNYRQPSCHWVNDVGDSRSFGCLSRGQTQLGECSRTNLKLSCWLLVFCLMGVKLLLTISTLFCSCSYGRNKEEVFVLRSPTGCFIRSVSFNCHCSNSVFSFWVRWRLAPLKRALG